MTRPLKYPRRYAASSGYCYGTLASDCDTCHRHPDGLHRVGARRIAEMGELQADLLERAAHWLKPGGVLVYAACSFVHRKY